MPSMYAGATTGEALKVTVRSGASGVDMTTVTAVELCVRSPNGACVYWPTVISDATSTQLFATATGGPGTGAGTVAAGDYRVMPLLTVPSGVIRGEPFNLTVQP